VLNTWNVVQHAELQTARKASDGSLMILIDETMGYMPWSG
jgi:hypothetical protein